ncbi:hypothetical protein FACS189498_1720 [Spirochaetia bacterium]|nr:hypothetical protein FACS189498_1720 [Spirochaetia bacterium]
MEFIKAKNRELFCGDKPILLRGFGFGGWLLPEGYMWKLGAKCNRPRQIEKLIAALAGETYAASFWKRYYDLYVTEDDVRLIAERGYNSIRIPINARHLYRESGGDIVLRDEAIALIDRLIAWCRSFGIYAVLDMHGAPGGQTGQNIDDSERDQPELFIEPKNEAALIRLWQLLAERYRDESAVAGYDLLNEPLPEFFNQYYPQLLPLYEKLIAAIRKVDKAHTIIVEGFHWDTDFSVFDPWFKGLPDANILLQFHKYWSCPDTESIQKYLDYREHLNLPLWMGEGGENNIEWYIAAFSLYERHNISWNFWTYRKMATLNSPHNVVMPKNWNRIQEYIEGREAPSQDEAITIFDEYLHNIEHSEVVEPVFRALNREPPIRIPAEFYDDYAAETGRVSGAEFRMGDRVSILFADGRQGLPDYHAGGGDPQPEKENMVVLLCRDEWLEYSFNLPKAEVLEAALNPGGPGDWEILCGGQSARFHTEGKEQSAPLKFHLEAGEHRIRVICRSDSAVVDDILLGNLSR